MAKKVATVEATQPTTTTTTAPKKRKSTKKADVPTSQQEEHIVVQLPITTERIQSLIQDNTELLNPLEYSASIIDPEPYAPSNNFTSHSDAVFYNTKKTEEPERGISGGGTGTGSGTGGGSGVNTKTNCCYWCCHPVGTKEFGMPIKYDIVHDSFTTFGCFCSLECVSAHNYSHYMGSDRMWEINSWIQWMGHKLGYEPPIRPAPSRYLLKMFNGSMDIDEFRELHKTYLKTYVMNMPPLIHIQGQVESINTSYLNQKITTTATNNPENIDDKVKLYRNTAVVDTRRTLDAKLNLTIKSVPE